VHVATVAFNRCKLNCFLQFNLETKQTLNGGTDRTFSGQISTAFREKNWEKVLSLLIEMRCRGEDPKLGALQRWVRDCDVTVIRQAAMTPMEEKSIGSSDYENNLAWLLLDAVMRVFHRGPDRSSQLLAMGSARQSSTTVNVHTRAVIHKHLPYVAPSSTDFPPYDLARLVLPSKEHVLRNISTVSHVPGPQRRPPNKYDLNVITNSPSLLDLSFAPVQDGPLVATPDKGPPAVQRHDVPGVPGAFLLTNVFSPWACNQIMHLAESVGYVPDAVEGIDNVIWLAEDSLVEYVFERVRHLLPSTIASYDANTSAASHKHSQDTDLRGKSECGLMGINATWRLFRYYPGSVYRPHIDGAWPGSGIRRDTGLYAQDAFDGDRFSKLTFLVYLNDDFSGGETTFYLPSYDGSSAPDNNNNSDLCGHINARSVRPSTGSVLCFPHGDAMGSLVHEGSEVVEGLNSQGRRAAKYVIRSDVLYSVAK
jgi:hypothetical protein